MKTLEIYRAGTGRTYVNYPTALMVQGQICGQTARLSEAEKLLREAVQIRAENVPKTHFLHAATNWRARGIPERTKPLRGSRALSTRELREPKKFTSRRESAHPAGPPAAGSALRKLEKAGGSRSLSA